MTTSEFQKILKLHLVLVILSSKIEDSRFKINSDNFQSQFESFLKLHSDNFRNFHSPRQRD